VSTSGKPLDVGTGGRITQCMAGDTNSGEDRESRFQKCCVVVKRQRAALGPDLETWRNSRLHAGGQLLGRPFLHRGESVDGP